MKLLLGALLGLAAASGVSLAACSSDSSHTQPPAGCAGAPFTCAPGQTCWVANMALEFQCLSSGSGKVGDACQNNFGQPSCGDGLFCLEAQATSTQPMPSGVCTAYCDTAHPCAAPAICTLAQVEYMGLTSQNVSICYSMFPSPDAGPTPDASTDAAPPGDSASDGQADTASPTDAPGDGPTE